MTNWQSTGNVYTHTCGCVVIQQTETGCRDYHERWVLQARCERHEQELVSA